jgi:hypothetical protein
VSEQYAGRQIVGMDLHRRRSVLVRMTDTGERLETVRISNDPEHLAQVMARAGEAPEVVLEAAYGWYWAADTLAVCRDRSVPLGKYWRNSPLVFSFVGRCQGECG